MCLILLLLLRQWFFCGEGMAKFYLAKAVVVVVSWAFELGVMVEQQDKFVLEPGWKFGWLVEWMNKCLFVLCRLVSWHFVLFLFIQVFKNFMIFLCLRGVYPPPPYTYTSFYFALILFFLLYIFSSLHGITRFVANTTNVHFYHSFSYFLWLSEEISETYSTIRGTPSRCCSHHWWLFQRRLYKILC